jgi:hypothetical protein
MWMGRQHHCKLILGAATVLLSGCELDNSYRPYPEPGFDTYIVSVQPIVSESCASLGCHGTYDRRLTLFAEDYLRGEAAVTGTPLEDRLTEAELAWNYDGMRMRLVDEDDADTSFLLLKCLDPEQGGIRHAGDAVVFDSVDDPDYRTLRDWIEEGL